MANAVDDGVASTAVVCRSAPAKHAAAGVCGEHRPDDASFEVSGLEQSARRRSLIDE